MCVRTPEKNARPGSRKVVLVTLGSWGDVLPYVAIALGLRERGHTVTLATSACYREKVQALGLDFRNVRPDSDWVAEPALMRRRSHPGLGLIRVASEWLLPALKETYEDTAAAAEGADLLVSHPLAAYAARLVAEKTRVLWVSTMMVPLECFSVHDGTELPLPAALSVPFRWLGPRFRSLMLWSAREPRGSWPSRGTGCAELGLPPATDGNPLSESHSPDLNLALFSKLLADRQPDWTPQTVITGFPISPRAGGTGLPPELDRFLDSGPPPLVFTLGTAVGSDSGRFYETSLEAARAMGFRAVLVGSGVPKRLAGPEAITLDYAPYAELFPRSAVIVHHGGIGTTGLAMRSGRPMLVMPRAWDQPDNAKRVARASASLASFPGVVTRRLVLPPNCGIFWVMHTGSGP